MTRIDTKSADPACWSCLQPSGGGPLCIHCGRLLPLSAQADFFNVMGLGAKRMSIEPGSLEEPFYALSRLLHPDRYQMREAEERRIAEERTAALNLAYSALRDPVARAQYILRLEGGLESEPTGRPPAELLAEVMELQERVEDYRSAGEESRKVLGDELTEARRELEARWEAMEADLQETFCLWDRRVVEEGSEEDKAPLLERLRTILTHRRYLTTTIRDIAAALAGEPAPDRTVG